MSGLRRPSVAGAAAVLAAALLAACGGGDPVSQEGFGAAKLQTATCHGWRDASPQERQAVVERLAEEVAGPHKDGATLPDDVAYTTLDARCQPEFAKGFLLYELYIRAAAFSSLAE